MAAPVRRGPARSCSDWPSLPRVVVDERRPTCSPSVRVAQDVVQDLRPGVAAPIRGHAVPELSTDAPTEREQPALEPDRAERHDDRAQPSTTTDSGMAAARLRRSRRRAQRRSTPPSAPRQDHAPGLLHARVPPHLSVEPEQVVDREVDDDEQRQVEPEVVPVPFGHGAFEPDDQGDRYAETTIARSRRTRGASRRTRRTILRGILSRRKSTVAPASTAVTPRSVSARPRGQSVGTSGCVTHRPSRVIHVPLITYVPLPPLALDPVRRSAYANAEAVRLSSVDWCPEWRSGFPPSRTTAIARRSVSDG